MSDDDYTCRKCHQSMYVPDGMDPLEESVRFCESCAIDEIERLQADVERLKSVRCQLWNGIGVMRAALTEKQRYRVARICYETTGLCFCGCHETEFEPMMAGDVE